MFFTRAKHRSKKISMSQGHSKQQLIVPLEPRIMFDAAAVATVETALVDKSQAAQVPHETTKDIGTDCKLVSVPVLSSSVVTSQPREIAVIDQSLPDYQTLIAGLKPGVELLLLNADTDAVQQITQAVHSGAPVSALYLFGHGAPGLIRLGNDIISNDTLASYANQLTQLGKGLTSDGDILLYSCDTALGSSGAQLLTRLSQITQADIAASSNPTGAATDWVLEAHVGTIEATTPLDATTQLTYAGVLDAPTITSIVRQNPTYETTNADTVTFRVTFSEKIQNIDGTDFVFAPGSVSGATVQLVTPVANSNGLQYDVQVGGVGSATGSLNLDLSAQSDIRSLSSGTLIAYTNPAGGNTTSDQSFNLDHSIATPVLTGVSPDTGASSSDFITSETHLVYSGTSDPSSFIRVYVDGTSVGTTTSNATTGAWSIDCTAATLAEGSHNVTVFAQDVSGNYATSSPVAITVDTTAPVLQSGTVSDVIVTLNYTEAQALDAVNTGGTFTVKDNGSTIAVNSVSVDAVHNTVMLTLASPVTAGHTITVSYTKPTGGDDAHAIQDKAGNDAASVTDFALTNNTNAANTAPVISDVSGSTWYSKGDSSVAVFSGTPTLTDTTDTYLEGATISITTNRQTNDVLSVFGSLPTGITASTYDSSTGVLTLSGHATLADYQTALSSVRFANSTGQSIDTDRTITLTVNDGQTSSTTATRTMHVLGQAFSLGDTTSAYLLNGSGTYLYGVNLVMGTITTLQSSLPADSMNALGFSPVDGHLYASDNKNGVYKIIRINADGTTQQMSASYSGGNSPAASTSLISADIDANGIMYLNASGANKIYRFDTNPSSSTYLTWLTPLSVSGAVTSTQWVDMAINPVDNKLYAAGSNLYRIDPSTGATTDLGTITGESGGGSYPMQYFDKAGFFYFTSGGSNPVINRLNITNPSSPSVAATQIPYTGSTLPTSGDAGRIVTINLDFGDAPDSYKTQLASDGARHSLLNNTTWIGTAPDAESDGPASGTGTTDNTTGTNDENSITFGVLPANATTYSVDVPVTNNGSGNTTLIGWIDFNKNGTFDENEAATATVAPGATSATLTWSGMSGMTAGATYARFRIGTTFVTPNGSGQDERSYGPMMDGEVEDYAFTISAADHAAPVAAITPVSPDPRHTTVGTVAVTFTDSSSGLAENVTGVDISDFTLTRDGNAVSITGCTVSGSGANYTIDLSSVTSPAGVYVLSLNANGSIKDASGNAYATAVSDSFTIDTTAPVIDLDPTDVSNRDYRVTSPNGSLVSLDNGADQATLIEASNSLTQLTVKPGGLQDGSSEYIRFGSTDLRADGGSGNVSSTTVGGVLVDISYSAGTFAITKNGGGTFTAAEGQAIIRDLSYHDDAALPTTGARSFSLGATDLAGITSTPTVSIITIADTNPPDAPVITGISDDTGTVGDHITADTTLHIIGTAEANSTVEVFVDGVSKGTTTTNAGGNWDFDYTGTTLTNGVTYHVTAKATDAAANTSSSSSAYDVTIDTSAPAITSISTDSGITGDFRTNDQTLSFGGTAAPGETVTVKLDGTVIGTPTADSNGTWTVDYTGHTLTPGSYTLTAEAGSSPVDTKTVVIDTTAPLLTTTSPADNAAGVAVGSNIVLTFDEDVMAGSGNIIITNGAGDTRTISITDTTQVSISGTTITINPTDYLLKNTGYYVQMASGVVKDTAGNDYVGISDTTTFNFTTVNSSPPVITDVPENHNDGYIGINAAEAANGTDVYVSLTNTGAVAGDTLTMYWGGQTYSRPATLTAGEISAGTAIVTIPGATITTQGDGTFSVTAKIGSGPVSDPYAVTVDTVAPASTPTVDSLSTTDTTPTLTGTATLAAGETLMVVVDGVTYTQGDGNLSYNSGNHTWSLAIPSGHELTERTYPVTATIADAAGNTSSDVTTNELVIDLTPPATPTVDSQPITRDTTPTITGTANVAAGEYLTVTVGTKTYTEGDGVLVRTSTNWTLTIPDADHLADGTYNVVATVHDAAGNMTSDVTAGELIIDATAPAKPVVTGISSDSGAVGDHLTNDTTLIFNGTAEANSTVTVFVDGVSVATTTADGSGNWNYDYTGTTLTNGSTYQVTAKATDAAGNISAASDAYAVTIDTTGTGAPTVAISTDSNNDGYLNNSELGSAVTVSVSIGIPADAVAGNTINYSIDGGNTWLQHTLSGTDIATTHWDTTVTKPAEGATLTVVATVTDAAGNTSAQGSDSAVIDTNAPGQNGDGTAPAITGISTDSGIVGDFITNDQTLSYSGTAGANETVTVTLKDSGSHTIFSTTVTADASGHWSLDRSSNETLASGSYTLSASTSDVAGNVATASQAIVIDTNAPGQNGDGTAPAITGISTDSGIVGDFITNDQTLSYSGTAGANETVTVTLKDSGSHTIFSTTVTADASGHWSLDRSSNETLASGSYTLSASTSDVAGNVATASQAIVIDTSAPGQNGDGTAPAITAISTDSGTAGDFITNDQTLSYSGTAGANETVTVTLKDSGSHTIFSTTVTADASGHWSLDRSSNETLASGSYTLSASTSDVAGNVATASQAIVIDTNAPGQNGDGTAPAITAISTDSGTAGDFITNDQTLSYSGTAGANETVTVTLKDSGSHTIFSTTTVADGSGHWSLDRSSNETLASGSYTLSASTSDVAGNVATASQAIVIDTSAPGQNGDGTAPAITAISTDSGTAGDFITNDQTLSYSGTAGANETVTVTLKDSGSHTIFSTTVTADASGHWSLDRSSNETLASGSYTLSASTSDVAGNVATASQAIVIDTSAPGQNGDGTAPAITGISTDSGIAGDFITNDQTLSYSGTAGANETVAVTLKDSGNHTIFSTTVTADASGHWSLDRSSNETLASGSYTLSASTSDVAGNVATASQAIVIDISAPGQNGDGTAPAITGISTDSGIVGDFITNDQTLSYSGTAGANETVTVTLKDSGSHTIFSTTVTADASGHWSLDRSSNETLASGSYTLSASTSDVAGNVATASQAIVIDTNAPATPTGNLKHDLMNDTGSSPNDNYTANSQPTLNGTAEAGSSVEVTIDGHTYNTTASADGVWSVVVTSNLTDGTYVPVVKVTDVAGNSCTVNGTAFVVDTIAPSAPTVDLVTTLSLTPTITGTWDNTSGNVLTVELNSVTYTIGDGHLSVNGNIWTLTVPSENALTSGKTYDVSAQVTDLAGSVARDHSSNELIITVQPITPGTPPTTPTSPTQEPSSQTPTTPGTTVDVGDSHSGASDFDWSSAALQPVPVAVDTSGNNAGLTANPLQDTTVHPGELTTIELPTGTFQQTDPTATTRLEARQANGQPLPNWLQFDPVTGTFSGTPPANAEQAVQVVVLAQDSNGNSAATRFDITVSTMPQTSRQQADTRETVNTNADVPQQNKADGELPGQTTPQRSASDTTGGDAVGMAPGTSPEGTSLVFVNGASGGDARGLLFVNLDPPSQEAIINRFSQFQLPSGIFGSTSTDARVTVEAELLDGTPLPQWLTFDPHAGVFKGTPPKDTVPTLEIRLVARDNKGHKANAVFTLRVKAGDERNAVHHTTPDQGLDLDSHGDDRAPAETPVHRQHAGGRLSLSDQFARQGRKGLESERQQMVALLQKGFSAHRA